ncbi:MAG TPA: 7-carboxy-7-deazaguanine synthase QueE [Acidimicrobiales bacterium]|nr:7-carboxy-7-deazaguanine synthase QueE [Acidimicrobiales bacterium]
MTADPPLVVNEVFGPTIQGEGPAAGRRCAFLRLGRCNLSCAWCDTPHSWDWSRHDPATELVERTTESVFDEIASMRVDMVVVTGGEPLLQWRRLPPLFRACRSAGWEVHVETAGTLPWIGPTDLVTQWVVSPKLANSQMPLERRYRPAVLAGFVAARAAFKFVVTSPADLDEIAGIVTEVNIPPRSVWIMPEGTDRDRVVRRTAALADAAIARGWNLTTRLHVIAWGAQRGR